MGAVGRRVAFRPGARIGTIAASLAAAATLLLPNAAFASTAQIGSTGWSEPICTMLNGPFDSVQATSSGDRYVVPSGGSITSWSVLAGADAGPVGLEVWKETAPLTFALVGSSPVELLTGNSLNKFDLGPTSVFGPAITVEAGDLIGLRVEGPFACWQQTTDSADRVWLNFAATGLTTVLQSFQLNVAATVEVTVTPPPPPPPTPTSADQCKDGGWQNLTDSQGTPFKNQGDCVSFVATDGTNTGNGQPTVTPPPPPPATPTSADQCKKGGWQTLTDSQGTPFKNQGDCVSFVATDGTNAADGPPA